MEKACTELISYGSGRFYIGASARIQDVIHYVNGEGYGGFEELIGLPAMFGGIIYMNAGIGGERNQRFDISDFVESVRVLRIATGEIIELGKDSCQFGYRRSLFHNNQYVILGAKICLSEQSAETSIKRIEERRAYIREHQEWGKGCFGTCFCRAKGKLLKLASLFPVAKGVRQAKNNANWLVNDGNGSYRSAMRIINMCKLLHHMTFQKIECEVKIWR